MLHISRLPSGKPEIFLSMQGEGVSAGAPAVFLRLAMCNLSCKWCDTRYTWDFQRFTYAQEVVSLSREEVEGQVLAFDCPRLVITGGEPLLQQQELAPLASSLKRRDILCEVETNGTLVPCPEMIEAIGQWNISPKLANSGNPPDQVEVASVLEALTRLGNAYFKFVIVEPGDVTEVRRLVRTYGLSKSRVLLMPEGTSARDLSTRGAWLAEVCIESGFRFSPRLHVMLWGDERGR